MTQQVHLGDHTHLAVAAGDEVVAAELAHAMQCGA